MKFVFIFASFFLINFKKNLFYILIFFFFFINAKDWVKKKKIFFKEINCRKLTKHIKKSLKTIKVNKKDVKPESRPASDKKLRRNAKK